MQVDNNITMNLISQCKVLPLLLHLSVIEYSIGALTARFLEQTIECHDKLGRDCFKYSDDQCVGKYALWAKEHCALRCGYCPQKLPCVDQITYCDEYEERFCSDERYAEYMRENCRRTCDLCRVPTEYLTSLATVSTTDKFQPGVLTTPPLDLVGTTRTPSALEFMSHGPRNTVHIAVDIVLKSSVDSTTLHYKKCEVIQGAKTGLTGLTMTRLSKYRDANKDVKSKKR
ncbi:uncharacterized protein LOC134239958 [Saccostrea cucullata]|uniref:uncharacterized protein LOC134239958 n=1 Tax=Saccostrea cuccullata TaxID=36930 RepID=UPI002ED005E7